VVNFTNHVYFNLTGKGDTIMDNQVQIFADLITAMGEDGLPTGEIVSVAGTMYDYTTASSLIDKLDPGERGYDINYVLRNNASEPVLAAVVVDRESGRKLEAYTTEPGMQLFTRPNSICLEMQHYPDSPNHPNFPSVVLNPGEIYHQLTVYKFSAVQE
jgi:aldose 1-epimerase